VKVLDNKSLLLYNSYIESNNKGNKMDTYQALVQIDVGNQRWMYVQSDFGANADAQFRAMWGNRVLTPAFLVTNNIINHAD
jgi:hypothetical protein